MATPAGDKVGTGGSQESAVRHEIDGMDVTLMSANAPALPSAALIDGPFGKGAEREPFQDVGHDATITRALPSCVRKMRAAAEQHVL